LPLICLPIPKKLASLGFGRRATPAQKTLVVQKLRQKYSLNLLLSDTFFSYDWDKGWHPETITIDVERVQKEYIDGKKPLEIIVSNLAEYLLLVNLVSLDPAEMETLLKAVQGWIREKHKGRGAVIQLPEDDSPECNEG